MSDRKQDYTAPLEYVAEEPVLGDVGDRQRRSDADEMRQEFPGLGDVHAPPNLWNVRRQPPLTRHEVTVLAELHRSGGSAAFGPSEVSRLVYQKLIHKQDGTWRLSGRGVMCLAQLGIIPTG